MSDPEFKESPDDLWVKETLVEDFAEAQRLNGIAVPSTRANEDVVLETLRELDQKESVNKPRPEPKPNRETQKGDQMLAELGARRMTDKELVKRQKLRDAKRRAKGDYVMGKIMEQRLLMARLKVLMSKPEWALKLKAAFELGELTPVSKGGGKLAYEKALDKILTDSNVLFGDWKNPPQGGKLIFT